jgi:hypothetical protein
MLDLTETTKESWKQSRVLSKWFIHQVPDTDWRSCRPARAGPNRPGGTRAHPTNPTEAGSDRIVDGRQGFAGWTTWARSLPVSEQDERESAVAGGVQGAGGLIAAWAS